MRLKLPKKFGLKLLKKLGIYLLVGVVFFPFIYVAYSWILVPGSARLVGSLAFNLGKHALILGFVIGVIAGTIGHYLAEEVKEQ